MANIRFNYFQQLITHNDCQKDKIMITNGIFTEYMYYGIFTEYVQTYY